MWIKITFSGETSNIALKDGFSHCENSDGKLIYKKHLLDKSVPLTHIKRLKNIPRNFITC